MWAGLLASSCSKSGDDDSNLIFITLLKTLSKLQARILEYACREASKAVAPNGLIDVDGDVTVDLSQLKRISGEEALHRLDRELDQLRALELITGGFSIGESTQAEITPTPLCVHLYVRCQGSRDSAVVFFKLKSSSEKSQ